MQDGLYRLTSPQAARVERVRRADGEPLRGGVHALRLEAGGRLWVGALAGLFRWDGERLAEVQGAPGEALGFPAVLGLLLTRDGSLYVDTAVSGLHRLLGYDAEGRARFERISERMGAPGRPFGVNLHEDANGRVWSQQSVYDPAAKRLDELSGAEGPPMGTPRFFADAALPDGRLLFSGSRGLLVVEPLAFMPSRYAPPVVVSSLRRNGQPFQPEHDLKQGLKLPAGTRSFAVEFAALDYIDPAKLRYMLRLDGVDAEWTFTDASARFASYGGLQPGRYRAAASLVADALGPGRRAAGPAGRRLGAAALGRGAAHRPAAPPRDGAAGAGGAAHGRAARGQHHRPADRPAQPPLPGFAGHVGPAAVPAPLHRGPPPQPR
jgi:hypothetical protein